MEEIRTSTTTQSPSGTTRTQEVHQMKKTKGGLIGGLVIILILLIAVLWFSGSQEKMSNETSKEIAPGQVLTEATTGDVVAGFPKGLILEEGITASQSYSIAYAEGNVSQPVLSYRSAKTLQENITAYGAYLSFNGWNVAHSASVSETPTTFFYAYKENAELNITFAPDAEGVMVTIAYVVRGVAQ